MYFPNGWMRLCAMCTANEHLRPCRITEILLLSRNVGAPCINIAMLSKIAKNTKFEIVRFALEMHMCFALFGATDFIVHLQINYSYCCSNNRRPNVQFKRYGNQIRCFLLSIFSYSFFVGLVMFTLFVPCSLFFVFIQIDML